MRKMYLIIGSVALAVGIVLGAVGYALATTPVDGSPRIAFWAHRDSQSTTGTIGGLKEPTSGSALTSSNPSAGLFNPGESEGAELYPLTPEEEALEPSEAEQGNGTLPSVTSGTAPKSLADDLVQEVIADYKLNIATLFEAWKSTDMVSFRDQLAKAYTGDLFEKHARQAEPFIAQGVGLEVSDIRFEKITVEGATSNSATLTASYSYVAQDYDIGNQVTLGKSTTHQVKVRANMVKKDGRWLITGETILQ